uniref:Myb/SANT-like DNA-binding domain-containing protein n=1 Tax=Glossina morsitans morsitans TaxID=37546 RepID=A0A1B0G1G4_GLOMM
MENKKGKRSYKTRYTWKPYGDEALLDLWAKNIEELRGPRRSGHVYLEIAKELSRHGINVFAEEVKTKIHNLTSKYRKERANVECSGGGPSEWIYYTKVHQIIGGQPIPNIQTEECITEDPLENTIKREEPELEIFPSSGSESDSAPRSQSATMRQSQNAPASPIYSKATETEYYRKQILNEFRKCNEQIHNGIARIEDFGRKMLQLEEEKIMLLREYLNNAKDIKTIFENHLNKN